MNLYPITVVQNFYDDPDTIRDFALKQNYTYCHERKNFEFVYPGGRTKDIVDLDPTLHATICKKLISIFHNTEHDVMRWALSTNFQSVTEEYGEGIIHTDSGTIFAGVLFLSPDAPLNSGTTLFKQSNDFNDEHYQKALSDNEKRFRNGELSMSLDYHKMFDEVLTVNNVYNTLIIYEGSHYHAANKFFGNAIEDSRLTQVFFINKIDAKKYNVFPIKRIQDIKL